MLIAQTLRWSALFILKNITEISNQPFDMAYYITEAVNQTIGRNYNG